MKKKLVALLMAFVSCFSLGATAFAAENPEQTFRMYHRMTGIMKE